MIIKHCPVPLLNNIPNIKLDLFAMLVKSGYTSLFNAKEILTKVHSKIPSGVLHESLRNSIFDQIDFPEEIPFFFVKKWLVEVKFFILTL